MTSDGKLEDLSFSVKSLAKFIKKFEFLKSRPENKNKKGINKYFEKNVIFFHFLLYSPSPSQLQLYYDRYNFGQKWANRLVLHGRRNQPEQKQNS